MATAQKRKSPDQETSTATADLCSNGCGFFGTAATKGMCSKCYRERDPADADAKPTAAFQEITMNDLPASVSTVPPPAPKKIKLSVPAAIASSADAAAGAVDTSSSSSSSPANATQQQKQEEDPAKKPAIAAANRCATCRKKVGLTGFRCRCGGTFCGSHRYSDAHACGFDYKAAGREQIAKQNPLVVAAKIAKI